MINTLSPLRILAPAVFCFSLLAFCGCATQKPIVVNFPVRAEPNNTPGSPTAQPPAEVQIPSKAPAPAAPSTSAPANTSMTPAQTQEHEPISVPVTQFNTPDNAPAQTAPQTDKDTENLVTANNRQFDIQPRQEDYRGGAVIYNWVPNQLYQLFVAPLELTTVILEPGEQIVSPPAAGDTADFMLTTTFSVEDDQQRQMVLIKAVYPGKQTTIAVNTNKRSYFFHAISYEKLFMPLVSFNYPLEFANKMKAEAAESQNRILMYGRVTDLDFSYQIVPHSVHKPAWMPDRVFNDGRKTYMSFPSASRASYAPVLFEVNDKNERVLLNYRVVGTYYIVDRVLQHAELVLDVNEGNIVTIIHKEE